MEFLVNHPSKILNNFSYFANKPESVIHEVDVVKPIETEEVAPVEVTCEQTDTKKIKQRESSEESEHEEEDNFKTSNGPRPRIEIVKIPKNEPNAFVCRWTWDVLAKNCALCRNDINSLCIECQGDEWHRKKFDVYKDSEVRCTASVGDCKHVYHSHCIIRWVKIRQVCPLCGSIWISLDSLS